MADQGPASPPRDVVPEWAPPDIFESIQASFAELEEHRIAQFEETDRIIAAATALGERKTPFVVASVLPAVKYKEPWEPAARRSDNYLAVQINILKWLDDHCADELGSKDAYAWFAGIGTNETAPTAKQVVEMCYFMRSFGFDVYMKVVPQETRVRLWIADRDAKDSSRDKLFWEQDLKTREFESLHVVTREERRRQRHQRRGALANIFEPDA